MKQPSTGEAHDESVDSVWVMWNNDGAMSFAHCIRSIGSDENLAVLYTSTLNYNFISFNFKSSFFSCVALYPILDPTQNPMTFLNPENGSCEWNHPYLQINTQRSKRIKANWAWEGGEREKRYNFRNRNMDVDEDGKNRMAVTWAWTQSKNINVLGWVGSQL